MRRHSYLNKFKKGNADIKMTHNNTNFRITLPKNPI